MSQIINTLQSIRDGALLVEASRDLNALITAIQATCKGGELVIKIKIEPFKEDVNRVLVRGASSFKPPILEPRPDFFYTTDDASLSTRNPRQRELELREISDAHLPPIDIDLNQEKTA